MTTEAPKQYVAYYRVSTDRQGASGLGLDAQRDAVNRFLVSQSACLLSSFVEVESGAKKRRPMLEAAIAECDTKVATLLIAKLDRLARNVHFIAGLMESRIDFVAVDNPHATKLMIHLLAAFAEHEREMISVRTKAALTVAKSRGVQLGRNGMALAAANKKSAIEHATRVRPAIDTLHAQGYHTYRELAEGLNDMGDLP